MMIKVRKSEDRGHGHFGWLETRLSFSFSHYHNPEYMGFSDLRVINQDIVSAGRGFETHGHADMEIVSYVLRGAVEHKDSLGTIATIRPGEVQRMTAGTGIRHSEYNPSHSEDTEFLQIWILPEARDLTPGYEQKNFGMQNIDGPLQLVASRDGRQGSITVHQDVSLYRGLMQAGDTAQHNFKNRKGWIQLVRGNVRVGDIELAPGDGAAVQDEEHITISAGKDAEFLLFDLRS
jgi:quercetin 2,3-dioxygenase